VYSLTARFSVVYELEVIGLRRTVQHRLQHWPQLLVPVSAADLVDLVPDTLFGGNFEHRVKSLVGSAYNELCVEDDQSFVRRAGTDHEYLERRNPEVTIRRNRAYVDDSGMQ
jgi:hypothetical protein